MDSLKIKIISRAQKIIKRRLFLLREYLREIINDFITTKIEAIVFYFVLKSHDSKNKKIINLINPIKKDLRQSLWGFEYFQLYTLVKKTEKAHGDIAEVGVYEGSSAKIICETTKKRVHLFDTFEGLPESGPEDYPGKRFKGNYKASYDNVKKNLRKYKNAILYKGLFPLTSKPIKNKKFSLVHLDADLYESTSKSLKFFYPRMSKGGVIICHDYSGSGGLRGVKKAVDEFFKNKPEIVIEFLVDSSQCIIIKI